MQSVKQTTVIKNRHSLCSNGIHSLITEKKSNQIITQRDVELKQDCCNDLLPFTKKISPYSLGNYFNVIVCTRHAYLPIPNFQSLYILGTAGPILASRIYAGDSNLN